MESENDGVMGKIKGIKSNIENLISDVNVSDLKKSINSMVKDAQKDFSKLVEKDLAEVKKKFQKEKSLIEKKVNSTLNAELGKAKKFMQEQTKEIQSLQDKLEKLVKANAGKVSKKKAAVKKATKKVAKVVKKAAPKKATKKAAKK